MKNSLRKVSVVLAVVALFLAGSGSALAAAPVAPTGKVNINTASAEQLAALPGIGEKLAARIVEQREKSGAFKTVQELMTVKGIGEKNLAKLESHLTTGDAAKGAAK